MIPIELFLGLSAILFIIGAYGVLTKRNAIIVLMCIELMLNAANINFVDVLRLLREPERGGLRARVHSHSRGRGRGRPGHHNEPVQDQRHYRP